MYTGPNVTNDNLVFGYDTGHGVADNTTVTRFYPGEPTTNYADDTVDAQGGWTGSYSLIDSATKKFRFNVSNFSSGAGWRTFVWDMRAHTGSAVTISATIEVPDDSPGDFAWVMMGQANSGSNGTSTANYLGYSATSERYYKNTKNTERITWSGTIGNTGTANQPNGYIGFTVWYNGGTAGTNSYIDVSNVQIEKISHATPFVNGSRSNTASLIDLKRNINMDISNVSFDSTGQPTFDGTDDYIELDDALNSLGSVATFEAVFKATETSSTFRVILGWGNGTSNYSGLHIGGWTSAYTDESLHVGLNSDTLQMFVRKGETFYKDNAFHHVIVTAGQNNYSIWIDGVEETFTFKHGSQSTHFDEIVGYNSNIDSQIGSRPYPTSRGYFKGDIPVVKVYDRILSDNEIKRNYNAYKKRFNI